MEVEKIGIINSAKRIIADEFGKAGFELHQVSLFGSRANDTARPDSDWDFLVITKVELPFDRRWDIVEAIQERLRFTGYSFDLSVCSYDKWLLDKNDVGAISYYADRGGVPV